MLKLPEYVKGTATRIAPIVSSGRAAKFILQYWEKHFGRTADMVVVEGPQAGGHLGFPEEVLDTPQAPTLGSLIREVVEVVAPLRENFRAHIPVIAAGGVYSGADIADCLSAGAAGVQMATRFVATHECDAHPRFKEAYVAAREEDVVIIKSPVGMPGRALNNPFIQSLAASGRKIRKCFGCLQGCNPKVAPYCISTALINAVTGNVDEGLIFTGSQVHRIDRIVSVKQLMADLMQELRLAAG